MRGAGASATGSARPMGRGTVMRGISGACDTGAGGATTGAGSIGRCTTFGAATTGAVISQLAVGARLEDGAWSLRGWLLGQRRQNSGGVHLYSRS